MWTGTGTNCSLSDILGTENDIVSTRLEEEVNRNLLYHALTKLNDRETDYEYAVRLEKRQGNDAEKKWRTLWEFPKAIYQGWKRKSFIVCREKCRNWDNFQSVKEGAPAQAMYILKF